MPPTDKSAHAAAFHAQYITGSEIMRRLNISRSALLMARRAGRLPDAIKLDSNSYLWVRSEVEPYVEAWKVILERRRECYKNSAR